MTHTVTILTDHKGVARPKANGDENIVDVQAVVQYKISDLPNYLFLVDDPGDIERGVNPGSPDVP